MADRGAEVPPSRALWVTLLLGLATFVVGVIGLYRALPGPAPLDVAYRALQLFVLDGGALDPAPGSSDPLVLNPLLQVARFAAPVVTVTAVVLAVPNLLRRSLLRRWGALTPGHVVVCGGTPEAIALARHVRATRRPFRMPVVLVVSDVDVAPRDLPVVVGRPGSATTLRAAGITRAGAVYAMTRSSASNTAIALAAVRRREHAGRRPVLRAYAQVRGEDLIAGLRLTRTGAARPRGVDFFTLADVAADRLLGVHPPGDGGAEVTGSGELRRAVERALGRREADAVPDAAGTIYVCGDPDGGDEDRTVACALHLATARSPWQVVLCLPYRSPFADVVDDDGPTTVFGVLDEVCNPDTIADGSITNRIARAVNERYRTTFTDDGANPSAATWDRLPRHLKDSNVAQAEHIGVKLGDIGVTPTSVPPSDGFAFSADELDRLARAEHVRWVAERRAAGYRYGPRRTGREHPDLVEWAELSDEAKDKDVDAVRNLPALLADEGVYLRRNDAQ